MTVTRHFDVAVAQCKLDHGDAYGCERNRNMLSMSKPLHILSFITFLQKMTTYFDVFTIDAFWVVNYLRFRGVRPFLVPGRGVRPCLVPGLSDHRTMHFELVSL